MSEAANIGRVRQSATRLPQATRSAGQAREFVTKTLRSWSVAEDVICDIVLAASELVTNSLEHGAGEITVELSTAEDHVVLRVRDEGAEVPVARPPSLLSARSRGLTIVTALSDDWGHQPDGGGKWVWAWFGLHRMAESGPPRSTISVLSEN